MLNAPILRMSSLVTTRVAAAVSEIDSGFLETEVTSSVNNSSRVSFFSALRVSAGGSALAEGQSNVMQARAASTGIATQRPIGRRVAAMPAEESLVITKSPRRSSTGGRAGAGPILEIGIPQPVLTMN